MPATPGTDTDVRCAAPPPAAAPGEYGAVTLDNAGEVPASTTPTASLLPVLLALLTRLVRLLLFLLGGTGGRVARSSAEERTRMAGPLRLVRGGDEGDGEVRDVVEIEAGRGSEGSAIVAGTSQ
jgi:hypothetical protein